MQITKEIINNPERRSHLTTSKLKTILLVSLISFTTLLVRQTLQLQHSCNPMINYSGKLPAECQIAAKTSLNNFDNLSYPEKEELKTPKQEIKLPIPEPFVNTDDSQLNKVTNIPQVTKPKIADKISQSEPKDRSNPVGEFVDKHSDDIVGAVAGVAGGVAIAAAGATAAFSIPVAGAVLIGLGIWYAIRTVL